MLNTTKPKGSKDSYWDLLKEQAFSEGTWNDDFISEIKSKIISVLNKYSSTDIKTLWEETEISLDTLAETDSLPITKLKDDVAEEILNMVFDSLDERSFSEPIFQSKYVADEDEDADLDDDELDGFSDTDIDENEDNFDDEKF
ncbi:MAG: hypothetical protein Fur0015_08170 [Ignavibacteriales bacterium]